MRFLLTFALALLPLPAAAASPEPGIVVTGQQARAEIERILDADNLDTGQLSARDVAEVMENIPRGRAPDDFWEAYQAHVHAWEQLAAAEESASASTSGDNADNGDDSDDDDTADSADVRQAQAAIESTFDEVTRIAGRYGARLPVPRAQLSSIA